MKAGRELDGSDLYELREDETGNWIALRDGEVVALAPSHGELVEIVRLEDALVAALKAKGIEW